MRISDWSSDVCSSDLGRRLRFAADRGDPRETAAGLRRLRLPAAARPRAPDARRTGDAERPGRRIARPAATAMAADGRRRADQGRSEEPTSALQSLKRIASAVLRRTEENSTELQSQLSNCDN